MLAIQRQLTLCSATALIALSLSACSGSSSTTASTDTAGTTTGTTTETTTGTTSGSTTGPISGTTSGTATGTGTSTEIVPLSSLGPLSERLYNANPNRRTITGPIIGAGLRTNSELIVELPIEISEKMEALEVEAAYIIRHFELTRNNEIVVDEPRPLTVLVVTNVSNRMICNIGLSGMEYEFSNGDTLRASADDVFGYSAVEDEQFNFVSDRFNFDCLPPSTSAFILGRNDFSDTGSDGAPFTVDDVTKLTVGSLNGEIESYKDYVSFTDGLYASSYEQSSEDSAVNDTFNVTITNPSSRNINHDRSTVLFIDPESLLPIGYSAISPAEVFNPDVFAPGQEVEFVIRMDSNLLGSTNTIIVFPEYFDDDSR